MWPGPSSFLRLHAATLTAWLTSMGIGLPLLVGIAAWLDARRNCQAYVPGAAVALGVASLSIIVAERQFTTLSETGLFRAGGVLFLVWLFLLGQELRSSTRDVTH